MTEALAATWSLDDLYHAVLVVDEDRRILEANTAAARLLARTAAELHATSLDGLIGWRDSDGQTHAEGWPAPARLPGVRAIIPQAVSVHLAAGKTKVVTAVGTYQRDSTGRLLGAVISLQPPRRAATRAPTGMEIVSTVSHELRSPLTSVKGYTSLMLHRWDRLGDEQKLMMLEQVNHDADRVTRLITELLDISRLETGRLHLRRQLVDVPTLAATVVEKVSLEYPDLQASIDFAATFPRVWADPDKLTQVLTNLVENACKYASPVGLRIAGFGGEDAVGVAVSDRGQGIPASDLPRVFSKFFRRDLGRPTGSGLGLWISQGLVEAHGGELQAESVVGQGSTFRFTLPLIDLDKLQEQ